MILRRLGNKSTIAHKIIPYFPPHKIFVDVFFGAGGMFFNKPKAKFNILNDLDSDVFNLFMVVVNQKDELEKAFYQMPIHSDLLNYWKNNEETDSIKKALRFLFLSNLTWLGKGETLKVGASGGYQHIKQNFQTELNQTFDLIYDCQFENYDFRKFLTTISFDNRKKVKETDDTLIYCDPPYLATDDNYSNSFTEQDSIDLFNILSETGCKWAMSEFDNEFILQQAKERNLNVIIIGERQNLKNRRTEILITNYQQQPSLFD